MKSNNNLLLILICFVLIGLTNKDMYAQSKKQKARVSINFNSSENVNLLKVSAKYKKGKSYTPAANLDFKVYLVIENDSLELIGAIATNNKGIAVIDITNAFGKIREQYSFNIIHDETEKFSKIDKTTTIKVAKLSAALKTTDEKHFISAQLLNVQNEPIEGAELKVQLQRLFSPLAVGEGSYFTDENGNINVPITEIMPGLDGKLNYEVVLQDSDDYGTIKAVIPTTIGKHIEDLSTFDQRTMWSPPSKTPVFLLIILNVLIFGIWAYLSILMFNLYRIYKHKN